MGFLTAAVLTAGLLALVAYDVTGRETWNWILRGALLASIVLTVLSVAVRCG